MPYYEKAKALLYKHVDVVTKVSRSGDFCSDFLIQSTCLEGSHDRRDLIFTGCLKSIDPISHSVILCHICKEKKAIINNIFILGRNICDIRISNDVDQECLSESEIEALIYNDYNVKLRNHPYFYKPSTSQSISSQELTRSQTRIISWFQKYRIPISLDGQSQELIVADCVRIKPPYEHESDFICPTRVILKRIKYIVDKSNEQSNDDSLHN